MTKVTVLNGLGQISVDMDKTLFDLGKKAVDVGIAALFSKKKQKEKRDALTELAPSLAKPFLDPFLAGIQEQMKTRVLPILIGGAIGIALLSFLIGRLSKRKKCQLKESVKA